MENVVIKTAGEDFTNWDTLLELLRSAFAYQHNRIDPPSSLNSMDATSLNKKAQEETLFLAFIDNDLIGCAFVKPLQDSLYIGKFAVSPTHQGKGVGKKLIQAAENLARTINLTELELETRIELHENHQTFAKFGLVKTEETAHAGYERTTGIVMKKKL